MIVRKENESIFDIVGRAAPPTPYSFIFPIIFRFFSKFHGLAFPELRHIRPIAKKEGAEDEATNFQTAHRGGAAYIL